VNPKNNYEDTVGHKHNVAIAVRDLPATIKFFTKALGYQTVLVSPKETVMINGNSMVTLWEDKESETCSGLSHLALDVPSKKQLKEVYARVKGYPGVTIESKPRLMMEGPARHFIFTEPSGNRLEIVYWGG